MRSGFHSMWTIIRAIAEFYAVLALFFAGFIVLCIAIERKKPTDDFARLTMSVTVAPANPRSAITPSAASKMRESDA